MPETWDYTLYVPNDLRAVTVCRRTLRLILTLHGLIGLVDTAELLAAELVSNAVRHTKGPAALRVRRTPQGVVWIGAWDSDPAPPDPPRPLEHSAELEYGSGIEGSTCGANWGWPRQPAAPGPPPRARAPHFTDLSR
ncbi:ATP-binding protein [Streptomyces sp. MMG1121]|uniref:ATP-binding protein n=1 Tax=Streptomyces sp. MMG1121 TaxID=1415544 RepID=UPI0006B04BDC|nr:ATPase [Streptomyces sp. MMG1121]KOV63687.1 ATPase [Streptomyces sp. MMG1121]